MIRRGRWLLLAFVVPLAVAGCGGSGTPSASSSSSSGGSPSAGPPSGAPSASPPSPATTPPAPAGNGTLVEFGRQGGLAGVSDTLVVGEDGRFTLVRTKPAVRRSGQLTAADLAELRRVLTESRFAQLPKVQSAKGADQFTYQVKYRDSEILAQDGGMVPELKPVVATLSGLVARYSG